MKKKKVRGSKEETVIAAAGATSTVLGGTGAAIAAFGLCPCVLAPTLSLLGMLMIVTSFLAKERWILLIIGAALIAASIIVHKKKKTCRIHKKKDGQ